MKLQSPAQYLELPRSQERPSLLIAMPSVPHITSTKSAQMSIRRKCNLFPANSLKEVLWANPKLPKAIGEPELMARDQASYKAAITRFRSIMMTTAEVNQLLLCSA
jgi:hypothetical protein